MFKNIKSLDFFSKMEDSKLKSLLPSVRLKKFNTSEIMTYEEEDVARVYFLLVGEAKLYKVDRYDNEIFLYTLQATALLTNIGSLDDDQISCFSNIEFIKDSQVISFDMHAFKDLVKSENSLLINLVNALASQKQLMDCMVNMGMVYDGTAKVANMLYKHSELFNSLKKQEIAYRLNIQPATLSRILTKLTRKEIIVEDDHCVKVLQREELYELFHT